MYGFLMHYKNFLYYRSKLSAALSPRKHFRRLLVICGGKIRRKSNQIFFFKKIYGVFLDLVAVSSRRKISAGKNFKLKNLRRFKADTKYRREKNFGICGRFKTAAKA
jgi:hypothetical protein